MTDITIEALKLRRRELELDAVMIRGRVEEISHIIAEMERRRGGRPRKSAIIEMPQRVAGGVHEDTLTVVNEPEDAA
jgi:hypothetical protein